MALSGTLTANQGALVIESTEYDQLTVTVVSGTFTLEYPMGTVLASNTTSTTSYQLGAGQFKLQVSAGSVSYSVERVTDGTTTQQTKVMTDAEFAILVEGSGLTLGTIYRVGTPEVWYRATDVDTYTLVSEAADSLAFSEAKSATGYTSAVSNGGNTVVLMTLAQSSGLLTAATVQLEKESDGTVYGVAYYPGPARYINLPAGTYNIRANVVMLSGTSPAVLISL